MNEHIDLTKILKDCPKGFELYSTIHGKVYFNCITNNKEYPICVQQGNILSHFTKNGKYLIDKPFGECTLFPSKKQRDWNNFNTSWYNNKEKFDPKTLNPFDKVLVRDDIYVNWNCDLLSHIIEFERYPYKCIGNYYTYCIPYNDDTKHLLGTKDEAPEYYRYWED